MGSEKNFRSHYYEKVGFRGVEEKKSLDLLLGERPLDLDRIHNFCLRFPLPGIYRAQVWQLLLGVLPTYTTSTEWVWRERVEQFRESERALAVTKKITKDTERNKRITIVWLMENNKLKFDLNSQLKEASCENFAAIVNTLYQLVSTPEEVYWIACGLYRCLESFTSDTRPLNDCLAKLLAEEPVLLSHLETSGVLRSLQYTQLWSRGFAGIFQPCTLARLWDKLIGGSSKVLVYVLASAIFRCRVEVMGAETQEEVINIISNMKEDRQEVVLTQALDSWEMDGCPLTPGHCTGDDQGIVEGGGELSGLVGVGLDSRLSMEIKVVE